MSKTNEAEFKPTPQMYTTLFNGITDARKYIKAIDELLDNIQQKAEQLYIEQEKNKARCISNELLY